MKAASLPMPGMLLGAYPERRAPAERPLPLLAGGAHLLCAPLGALRLARYRRFAQRVGAFENDLPAMGGAALDGRIQLLRARLSRHGFDEPLLIEAFALVRHVSRQMLGHQPYDTQLIAARAMLDNRVAEMATGEGKTLAAAICAAVGALAGVPVHVITVNDYLARRDAETMLPLYAALGLDVGYVLGADDVAARQRAYACDVTYCTARELVFDYLRDRRVRNPHLSDLQRRAAQMEAATAPAATLLRGLCMAVVDEADSVLIDEARIPLILSESRPDGGQGAFHALALEFARRLEAGRDYQLDVARQQVALTWSGRVALEQHARVQAAAWHNRLHREETACMALAALHLYRRDKHYLVHDGKVLIVDEATGRLAPGRVWSRGLQQLIELKEHCKPSGEQVTAAQITYQRFFRRYLRLGGMSGTVREARGELADVYALEVVRVPLRRPAQRRLLPTRLFPDRASQWQAVIARSSAVAATGRPVLIGTDSVAESEELARRLTAAGVPHTVLNARHDAAEAEIVARAGEAGRITVATNMAGRGTDIPLTPEVARRGGLHVICCQHNASRRIDRQLIGRGARQGDPGSAETLLALDKPRLARIAPAWAAACAGREGWHRPAWLVMLAVQTPQWLEERAQRRERRELLARDTQVEKSFSIAGVLE